MTDQEIIRAVATGVMGWTEKQMGPEWVWLTGGTYDRGDGYQIPCNINQRGPGAFNPLTNPAHWMLVVERMRELGWECQIWSFKTDYRVVFYHGFREWRELKERHYTKRESIGHAVCEAALRALG